MVDGYTQPHECTGAGGRVCAEGHRIAYSVPAEGEVLCFGGVKTKVLFVCPVL